jgi:hypothetical protein
MKVRVGWRNWADIDLYAVDKIRIRACRVAEWVDGERQNSKFFLISLGLNLPTMLRKHLNLSLASTLRAPSTLPASYRFFSSSSLRQNVLNELESRGMLQDLTR